MKQNTFQAILPFKKGVEVKEDILPTHVHNYLAKKRFQLVWNLLLKDIDSRKVAEAALHRSIILTCKLPIAEVWISIIALNKSDDNDNRITNPDLHNLVRKKLNGRLSSVLVQLPPVELHYLFLNISAEQNDKHIVVDDVDGHANDMFIGMGFERTSFLPQYDLERNFREANLRLIMRKMLNKNTFANPYDEAFHIAMKHDPDLCMSILKDEVADHSSRTRS